MRRDDRPLAFEGIPWDEYQLACVLASEGYITGLWNNDDWSDRETQRRVDDFMAKNARIASKRLRSLHHK